MLIDLCDKKITGKEAEKILVNADITCNKNMIPFDDQFPFITSWISLGTAAVTYIRCERKPYKKIAHCIDEILTYKNNL
ncbi:MAG: hypothetical protein ABI045_06200 [Flavobacteriales bacterium]